MTTAQDHIGIRYASVVLARGLWQGVVNVTLGAYNFDPDESNPKVVDRRPVVVDRLRMDIKCARDLHRALGEVLKMLEPPQQEDPDPAPAAEPDDEGGVAAAGKLN